MNIGIGLIACNNYSNIKKEKLNVSFDHNKTLDATRPSFGAKDSSGLTPEEAAALAGQRINKQNTIPEITEKDINFAVTCVGYGQVKGNSREVFDYRCSMNASYGYGWDKNFNKPHVIYDGNLDEKINGRTTAVVFPLHPNTPGLRGADNMTMLLSGNVDNATLSALVEYMAKVGALDKGPLFNMKYFVNSKDPENFMANPKIKTIIAGFFKQKRAEQMNSVNNAEKVDESKSGFNLKTSDINIANIDCKQNKNNKRVVKDYVREFLKNEKKFTVVYDKFTENNQEKDMTAILIPSKKSDWDCITVTIDKKIPKEDCKNLLNHLVKNNSANVENENFRDSIEDYLNDLR